MAECAAVGELLGKAEGDAVGPSVCEAVGGLLGETEGDAVGSLVGDAVTQTSSISSHVSPAQGSVPSLQPVVGSPVAGLQTSAPLQNRLSEHKESFGRLSHESVSSLQESTVQVTPSLQLIGVPTWQPRVGEQVSAPSHHIPLSHRLSLGS